MKGKVIKKFRDKETKSIYAVGDTIERDEARIAEINKVGGGPFIKVLSATEATVETEASEPETTEESADTDAEGEPAATRKKTRTTRAKKTKE